MLPAETKRWFPFYKPSATCELRLICLPYAGGGASVFRTWASALPPSVELCAAQPPGRETRFSEPAFTRAGDYVASLLAALRPLTDRPYALFGHSMGALMAFEVSRALRAQGLPLPARLFVSAKKAPHLTHTEEPAYHLPDAEFADYLRKLEGTSEEVLANPELRELFFPVLRKDFELRDSYAYQAGPPLDVPLRALGGVADAHVGKADLEAWREHTRSFLGLHLFPGGHLYLGKQRDALLGLMLPDLLRP